MQPHHCQIPKQRKKIIQHINEDDGVKFSKNYSSFRYSFIVSYSANMCFNHTYLRPLLKIMCRMCQIILQLLSHQSMNWSTISPSKIIMFFWWVIENIGQKHTVSVFQVYILFTWVAEKSTDCKNKQFSPNACKDTSVIPKQPPKSMTFSSRQLRARARTPSSVRLQHLFKEASCRYEQDEATAFIPGENTIVYQWVIHVYMKEMWLICILAIPGTDTCICMIAFFKEVHLWGYTYFPVMLSLFKSLWNVVGIFYTVCSIFSRISAFNSKPLLFMNRECIGF